jgi:hypothetical protein
VLELRLVSDGGFAATLRGSDASSKARSEKTRPPLLDVVAGITKLRLVAHLKFSFGLLLVTLAQQVGARRLMGSAAESHVAQTC